MSSLLEFVLRHPTRRLDEGTVRWVLEHFGPEGDVVDLRSDGKCCLVGCLVPSGASGQAAELFVMGYRAPGDDRDLLVQALRWAEQRARKRGAEWLEVTVPPTLEPLGTLLRERGLGTVFELWMLELPAIAGCRWLEFRPAEGRRWVDLGDANLVAAYECYTRALADVSGATILPLNDFRSLLDAGEFPVRCLELTQHVIALARVAWYDEAARVGEVRTIVRHPDHAEPKLGRLALAEALRQLRTRGAQSACVEVASDNLLAIGLYRSFAFREREVSAVFRLSLTGAG